MDVTGYLTILYRGPLSSCNYACPYCPFAKRRESRAEQEADRLALARFVGWVARRTAPTSVFFTPWGEALVRHWYREALVELSRLEHVHRVAIQTNLHAPVDALRHADRQKLALWCTYHPGEVPRARFLRQCAKLDELGLDYSVGVVGLREHFDEIEALREALPASRYLWINAYKRSPGYYDVEDIARLARIDPHFSTNTIRHPSRGRRCRTGESVVSVDGSGDMRRCHFVDEVIGNIYADEVTDALRPRPCPNATCGCHIGYVHMNDLGLYDVYAGGLLARIPASVSRLS